ncbi:unnamed protein product [Candidula unifasciata]|uniref:Uncharacterized protein n=1 Tax=Candidula unifasciata TaxID=100452 RepID=A0A8S3Z5C8_9EUPU|nr:unnamed protein product [Candidula unifasciata]
MADYSEFNNNNYLPGVYNDMEAAAAFNYHSALAHTRSPGVVQNGFTFTSPTQCSTMATYRPGIQTTSPIRSLSAPGVGAAWQHSIPVTMPWADIKSPISHLGVGSTAVFTGTPASPYFDGQLSCSSPLRRPKRKALDMPDEAPTSKIYLCADQFANLKISPSEKENYGLPADDGGHTSVQFYSGANILKSKGDIEGWQRFRDVENRLDVEVDEDIQLHTANTSSKDGPCLKVAEGILNSVTSSPILPHKIVEDMTKPCMQIILWKSPSEIMRDVAKEDLETTQPSSSSSASSSTYTTTLATSTCKVKDTSAMDITERRPLTPKDNMDMGQDTPMLDPLPYSPFQSVPCVGSGIPPVTDFITSPLLSGMALPLGHPQAMGVSPANMPLPDSDMFDDEMQL